MYKFKKSLSFILLTFILLTVNVSAQGKYASATVAFYNVENLFDTIHSAGYINGELKYNDPNYHISISIDEVGKYDTVSFRQQYTYENIEGKKIIRPLILQEEFLPKGKKLWGRDRYNQKVNNIAKVISELGKDFTRNAPVVVGLSEIENIHVIEDIINTPHLKRYNYGIIHFNSFDARGVDVGLIYQKNRFFVTEAKPHPVFIYDAEGKRKYTRDILQVTGFLDGEEMTFLVNHWPSRSGGEKASMPGRMEAAKVAKGIIDELRTKKRDAKVLLMGDLNDDPVSPSVKITFNAVGDPKDLKDDGFYNPTLPLFKKGIGTLAYGDSWNLFDQIITTASFATKNKDFSTYKIYKTEIFNKDYLIAKEGQYKGYPNRMWSGDTYRANGYSDHFPVYTILLKSVQ